MTEKLRVCAFYSQGPHFIRMLERLRIEYPGAALSAVVPPDYPATDEVLEHADAVLTTERPHLSPRNASACLRLVRQLRAGRYHTFAVMFDSNQLRVLAALSGAPRCLHATMDGRLVPLGRSVAVALAGIVFRGMLGRLVYTGIWLIVHVLPVRETR